MVYEALQAVAGGEDYTQSAGHRVFLVCLREPVKVLPEAFTEDPDRLARFEREAKVLASLNHPGIAAIYGLEESGDTRALVLELVEAPTLADRIAKGPILLDEALPSPDRSPRRLTAPCPAHTRKGWPSWAIPHQRSARPTD